MEKRFAILRFDEAAEIGEAGIMAMEPPVDGPSAVMAECVSEGYLTGGDARVIFAGCGISVVHVWFKRSFPLPLHSHDADCVYYIIGGGLRLGRETLTVGDGFFVPSDVPYTYTPGPDGVELLEIRNRDRFDYRERSTDAFWRKALATVRENREAWAGARRLVAIDN